MVGWRFLYILTFFASTVLGVPEARETQGSTNTFKLKEKEKKLTRLRNRVTSDNMWRPAFPMCTNQNRGPDSAS
jgi:hypothetical protein